MIRFLTLFLFAALWFVFFREVGRKFRSFIISHLSGIDDEEAEIHGPSLFFYRVKLFFVVLIVVIFLLVILAGIFYLNYNYNWFSW